MTKHPSTLRAIALIVGLGSAMPVLAQEAVTLWKSPDCSCCEDYAGVSAAERFHGGSAAH